MSDSVHWGYMLSQRAVFSSAQAKPSKLESNTHTHSHTHTHAHARFFLFLSLPPFVATAARPFVLPAAQPGLSWAGVHHCAVPHTHWRRPLTRAADVCGEEAAWQVGPALAQDPPRKRLWQRQVRLFLSLCLCVCVCVCVSVRLVCLSRWVCVTVSHISLLPSSSLCFTLLLSSSLLCAVHRSQHVPSQAVQCPEHQQGPPRARIHLYRGGRR